MTNQDKDQSRLVLWTEGDFDPFRSLDAEMIRRAGGMLRLAKVTDEEERLRLAREAVVLIAGWIRLPREVLSQMDQAVGVIRTGIGLDTVDLEAATELGLCVAHVPDFCLEEVAEHTLALLFAAARKVATADRLVRRGEWHRWSAYELLPIHRLGGQTLGLIGLGNIGRRVAVKAGALGMNVIAHDPFVAPETAASLKMQGEANVRLVELDELLHTADIVSLHLPLLAATRNLVNSDFLKQMKPGALLINTSRGPLVDEAALLEALKEGRLGGAGLDVLQKEPQQGPHPFFDLENVVLTCHYASCSLESYADMGRKITRQVCQMLAGEFPTYLANPKVKDQPQLRLRRKS